MTTLPSVSQQASRPVEAALGATRLTVQPETDLASTGSARIRLKTGHWLGLILIGHVVLALWYSLIIPPWEAHDEWAHFRHAAYIAENLALPDPSQRLTTEFEFDEASQPPLYYLLAAAPMLAVDIEDGYRLAVNPYASRGTGEGGVNFVLHDPAQESWPWSGTLLALHLGRLVSVLISTLALGAAWLLLRLLSPERASVALTAVALQAFAPQFVFLSAVMTNDILLIAVETALLYLALLLVRDGLDARRLLVLGILAALGLLSKYLALAMMPVILAAVLIAAWRHRHQPGQQRQRWLAIPVLLLPILLLGGWFLIRNLLLTGQILSRDPVSQAALLAGLQGGGALALAWSDIPFALRYGFETYWASFGWGNIGAPTWVYTVWLTLTVIGLGGVILWFRRQDRGYIGPLLVMCAIFIAAVVGLPLLRELLHGSNLLRGRYVLATLPLAVWVIAQGWQQLTGRWWSWVNKGLVLWPATLTIALAPLLILPAYQPPSSASYEESPTALPILANFGGKARLISADLGSAAAITPGQGLAVTLTWEVLDRTPDPYTLAIHLLGAGGLSYGTVTSYPGNGNAATTVWQPGSRFSETYWLTVRPSGSTPARGVLQVSLFKDAERAEYLPVFDSSGNPIGDAATFGELRIERPASAVTLPDSALLSGSPLATFGGTDGDQLNLLSARFPSNLPQRSGWATPFVLQWRAQAGGSAADPAFEPMQLSLQLLDADGRWVAGADGPVDDELPVHLWRAGDLLETVRWLELPPALPAGRYRVVAALYRPADLSRLPAFDAAGQPVLNDALPLGEILIADE